MTIMKQLYNGWTEVELPLTLSRTVGDRLYLWCEEHCPGDYGIFFDKLYLKNAEDATFFKLSFEFDKD